MNKAFTLIELLIVVAIIAILAAIAVPNFIEAQTRSKVGRAKNDLRTISVAMETYQVDCNLYPWRPDNVPTSWVFPYTNPRYNASDYLIPTNMLAAITTPLAYMASIPVDPFQTGSQPRDAWGRSLYEMAGRKASYILDRQADNMRILMPLIAQASTKYGIWSIGPDQIWLDEATPPWNYLLYDPTNGTLSKGNIWRTGP